MLEQRKAEWLLKSGGAKRETTVYEQHQIETVSVSHFVFASVCDNHWFFVANDLAALKALLDRVDHRGEKAPSLQANAAFSDATKHLPNDYSALLFVDPRPFVEKLMPIVAMTGQSLPMDQLHRLKQVRTVATTFGFDHGKMRETDFVAMPRMGAEEKLERRYARESRARTLFFTRLRAFPGRETMFSPTAPGLSGLPAALQQLTAALKARGIAEK